MQTQNVTALKATIGASRLFNPSRKHSIVGLDLLRLASALFVVIYHYLFFSWMDRRGGGGLRDAINAPLNFSGAVYFSWWGWIGVQTFFVISGFVIVMSARGKTAREFAVGRFSRLFPSLLFFSLLALTVVLCNHLLPERLAVLRWMRTIILFPKGPWIDGVIWTLTIEAIFYFLIFVLLLTKRMQRLPAFSRIALTVITIFWSLIFINRFVLGLGVPGHLLENIAQAYASRVILLTTGSYFLVGIFIFETFESGLSWGRLGVIAVAVICSTVAIYDSTCNLPAVTELHQSPIMPIGVWLFCLLLLLVSLAAERRHPPNAFFQAIARRLGLMTYPLYLIHYITGAWIMGRLYDINQNKYFAFVFAFILVLAISYMFGIYMEPWLRRAMGMTKLTRWARSGAPASQVF